VKRRLQTKQATITFVGLLLVTGVIALALASPAGHTENPALQVVVRDVGGSSPTTDTAPPALSEFSNSVYEARWELCQQPWSTLLTHAGERRSRSFSRSALREVAESVPYSPNPSDPLLHRIATAGCVAGFLHLLQTDRRYALS
jgi:hypothetical protein